MTRPLGLGEYLDVTRPVRQCAATMRRRTDRSVFPTAPGTTHGASNCASAEWLAVMSSVHVGCAPLQGPAGEPIDLWRTLQSHGVAHLPPNAIEDARTLRATVALPRGRPRTIVISQARTLEASAWRFSADALKTPSLSRRV